MQGPDEYPHQHQASVCGTFPKRERAIQNRHGIQSQCEGARYARPEARRIHFVTPQFPAISVPQHARAFALQQKVAWVLTAAQTVPRPLDLLSL